MPEYKFYHLDEKKRVILLLAQELPNDDVAAAHAERIRPRGAFIEVWAGPRLVWSRIVYKGDEER